jgi:hypothetical protein
MMRGVGAPQRAQPGGVRSCITVWREARVQTPHRLAHSLCGPILFEMRSPQRSAWRVQVLQEQQSLAPLMALPWAPVLGMRSTQPAAASGRCTLAAGQVPGNPSEC